MTKQATSIATIILEAGAKWTSMPDPYCEALSERRRTRYDYVRIMKFDLSNVLLQPRMNQRAPLCLLNWLLGPICSQPSTP
jgi:hypothetical protein